MTTNQRIITGPKNLPMRPVPCLWAQKRRIRDHAGQGQDQGLGLGGGYFQTFQGGEDRDDRGDETVTVEQGGAEESGQDQSPAQVGSQVLMEQGQHGEDAALPLIVGAHDEQGILDAHHQHE